MPSVNLVDVHTHLFNHRHLPIEGIARSWGLGRRAARVFARLISLAGAHPDAREVALASQRARTIAPISRSIVRNQRRAVWSSVRRLQRASYSSVGDVEWKELIEADAWFDLLDEMEEVCGVAVEDRSVPTILRAVRGQRVREFQTRSHRSVKRFLEYIVQTIEGGLGHLRFVFSLLRPVGELWKALQDGYAPGGRPDLYVHLMMDMQLAYEVDPDGNPVEHPPAPPALAWREQIDEMADLLPRARGRLLGFVAYDPRRSDALGFVRDALSRGFVGVKFYPPMGFRPYDTRYRPQLEDLYRLCVTTDVPLIVHCSAGGFEANPGSGLLSDPSGGDGFRGVLEAFPELRLCLGHAGAGHIENRDRDDASGRMGKVPYPGWYDPYVHWDSPRCYASEIVQLCCAFENVYCDFSYFTGLIGSTARQDTVASHLLRILDNPDKAGFAKKVMYGSDWHMPEVISRPGELLETFRRVFGRSPGLEKHADDFFANNALRFLDLPGAARRLGESGIPEGMEETVQMYAESAPAP